MKEASGVRERNAGLFVEFACCAGALGLVLALAGCAASADVETVGRRGSVRTVLPVNQVVTPAGKQVDLPGMRAQALALSPDGGLLVVSGLTSELLVLDPATGETKQRVKLPKLVSGAPVAAASPEFLDFDGRSQMSYAGLAFSPDGKRLALSNVNGDVKLFEIAANGAVTPWRVIALPEAGAPERKAEIPAGVAWSADGARLFVCGNLSNRLLEVDVNAGKVEKTYDVGVAPFNVVLAGRKLYVSNWGGRRPEAGDLTGPAGRGTRVRVDPVRFIACEGSVTVIDLTTGRQSEVITGLHASALAVSPDGRHVVCANAMSDSLSVIDTSSDAVV